MNARGGQWPAWLILGAGGAFGAVAMLALQAGASTLGDEALHRTAAIGAFVAAIAIGSVQRAWVAPPRPVWLLGGALVTFGIGGSAALIALDAHPLSALVSARAAQPLALSALSAAGMPLEPICARGLPSVPYERNRARVLLAGFGNGIDFACALQHGARAIDIAEPNAAVRARALASGATALAASAHVQLRWHATSARAFAATARVARYDLILLPATRAAHTWPAGLLPIAESTLQTDRGLSTLLSLLAPKGQLFAVVVSEPAALRFASTALLALGNSSVERPELHVVVHQSDDSYGIGLRVTPFELDEVLEVHRRARAQVSESPPPELDALLDGAERFPELRYAPGSMFQNRIGALLGQAGRANGGLARRYAFDIAPMSDERPLPEEWARRDRPDTWSSHSSYRVLPQYVLLAFVVALVLAASARAWTPRAKPTKRAWLALAATGCAQALVYAWSQHELGLWLPRPLQAFALNLLALFTGAGAGLVWGVRVVGTRGQAVRRALAIAALFFTLVALVFDRALARANGVGIALAVPLASAVLVALGFALALPVAAAIDGAAKQDPARPRSFLLPHALAIAVAFPLSATLVLYSGYAALATAAVSALTLAMLMAPREPA